MNGITRNNLIAGLFFPRQWRNWYFIGLGLAVLFFFTLSPNPELVGSSELITVNDDGVHFFDSRLTPLSYLVLAAFLWHFTVGTWRARLTTARQRREGYRPGEAPVASQIATRVVQGTTRAVRSTPLSEPVAQRTEAPTPVSEPPTSTGRLSTRPPSEQSVPQLVIPTVLGSGRKAQWAEDHGTFTVTDRRRFVVDEL